MTTFVDIRTALVQLIPDNNELSILFNYENKATKPQNGTPYARAFMLPGQPTQTCLGVAGTDRHNGLFQISLFYPEDKGDIAILTKADEIAAIYKSGVVTTFNGVNVTIESIGVSVASNFDGWFQLNLTINWYSFITRS